MSPVNAARSVQVPALVYQVRDDANTRPADVQAIFDAIPGQDGLTKKLFWIDGTTRRWDGYLHFQNHPDRVLDWIAQHTK
jgi:uncharacterized protein